MSDPFFPELLRYHRLRAGLTQRALADLSTVSPRAIRDLEAGRANARTQTIHLLADGLRLEGPMRELFVRASLTGRGVGPPRVSGAPGAPSILGRDAEAEALTEVLASGRRRVVVLSGLPGAGKTRLAYEIADRLAAARDWPAVWAEEDLTDAARRIGGADALVVLDGRRSATGVNDLLARCPGVRILATSRVPWRLPGVHAAVVGPLAVPPELSLFGAPAEVASYPAVRLLVERVAEVRPGFAPTPSELAAAASLCRRVDGLPLALEVVAGHGRLLSLGQLADLSTEELLGLGLPGRQGSLGALLAGALREVEPAHVALLRGLARPGRVWTVAEATSVLGRPLERTIDGLDSLIGHGLLHAFPGTHVVSLHVPGLVRAMLRRVSLAPAA